MIAVSQLRAFVAVVEVGTVTGAAAAIGRTQPQVSRLVTELEEEVGFRLFAREGRRLILGQRGARLYDEVKQALDTYDRLRQTAERIRRDAESELRILAPPYIAHTILPRVLAQFRSRYPTRTFSVDIVVRNAMGAWFPYRTFDVGLAALPVELPTVKVRRFAAIESVVALPKGHALSKKRALTLPDLIPYPFLAPNRNTALRKRLDAIFERTGLTPSVVGDTASSISAYEMVAEGLGWTILTGLVPLSKNLKSVEIRPWKPGSVTEFGFIYPAATSITPAVKEFTEIVEEDIEALGSRSIRLASR